MAILLLKYASPQTCNAAVLLVEITGPGMSALFGGPRETTLTQTSIGKVENFSIDTASDTGAIGEITTTSTEHATPGVAAVWDSGTIGNLPSAGFWMSDFDYFSFAGVEVRIWYENGMTGGAHEVWGINHILGTVLLLIGTQATAPTEEQTATAIVAALNAYKDDADTPEFAEFTFAVNTSNDGVAITSTEAVKNDTDEISVTGFSGLTIGNVGNGDQQSNGNGVVGVDPQEQIIFEITEALGVGDTFSVGGEIFTVEATGGTDNELNADEDAATQAAQIAAHLDGLGDWNASADGAEVTLTQADPGTGTIGTIVLTGATSEEGVYSFEIGINPVAGEITTISGETFTFSADGASDTVEIGADVNVIAANLAALLY